MIGIYVMTLLFLLYNSFAFLLKQKRYKNWLISIFYILSIFVLVFRICYYAESVKFFAQLKQHEADFKDG